MEKLLATFCASNASAKANTHKSSEEGDKSWGKGKKFFVLLRKMLEKQRKKNLIQCEYGTHLFAESVGKIVLSAAATAKGKAA